MREVKELRAMTSMSQVKFAEALGIPKRTIQSWEEGQRECPQYVADLIEYRITYDRKFKPKENKKATAFSRKYTERRKKEKHTTQLYL